MDRRGARPGLAGPRVALFLAVGYATFCAVFFLVFRDSLVSVFVDEAADPVLAGRIISIGAGMLVRPSSRRWMRWGSSTPAGGGRHRLARRDGGVGLTCSSAWAWSSPGPRPLVGRAVDRRHLVRRGVRGRDGGPVRARRVAVDRPARRGRPRCGAARPSRPSAPALEPSASVRDQVGTTWRPFSPREGRRAAGLSRNGRALPSTIRGSGPGPGRGQTRSSTDSRSTRSIHGCPKVSTPSSASSTRRRRTPA